MHGKENNLGDFSHWFFQAGLDIFGNLSLNMQSSNLYIQNYYEYLNWVTRYDILGKIMKKCYKLYFNASLH